jgi:hypothetical protein
VLGTVLIVVFIGQTPGTEACPAGSCAEDLISTAFEQAARRVLGSEANLKFEVAASDPPDQESVARATAVDGVVELSFTPADNKARVHCYVAKEQRWLDREISFGERRASLQIETVERGRLLGFAVASMFSGDTQAEPATAAPATAAPPPAVAAPLPAVQAPARDSERSSPPERNDRGTRSIEFAGIVSSGLNGKAAGLGASAALRLALTGPLWARTFVAGRAGNIPQAQASTRTALLGAGVALALLPARQAFELGARVDAFASYFDASHLSEDDIDPDRRSRWLAGGDLLAEGGVRIAGGAGVLLAVGVEAMLGKTDIYTHGNRVAVVPPLRAVAEFGFRTRF